MHINNIALEFSQGPTLPLKPNLPHRRFEEHVRKTPDSIAVFHDEGQLTYSQLNSRANHFGQMLKAYGVGPEVVVALYMERCPELVIGTIAIHKAGGACAFIEPTVPAKRLQSMLAEINPCVILTTQKYRSKLPDTQAALIVMDAHQHIEEYESISLPAEEVTPENLACIFFTSGTSGRPKAVMSPYGSYYEQHVPDSGTERHMLKTDSGTTFTRAEILRPLVAGQQLFITPPGLEKDFQQLAQYINKHGITHLISTPTALRVLLDLDNISLCHSLKSVTCSGENIPVQLKQDFLSRLNADLNLIYGCTEVPGAVSMKLSQGTEHELLATGRPAPMMEVHVLDDTMQAVPIGSEGEIYLGGLMARGYFNAPDLTAQKFVPHPFPKVPEQRLFKSGDRGRWLPNGYLQVLGRSDNQIKIRGFRIELDEIEAALLALPDVQHAIVVQRDDIADDKFLAAYVVPRNASLKLDELKLALKQSLPEYMIPRHFVLLSELPLTANGKIDRLSLPRPESIQSAPAGKSKPQDPFERHLISIWENLLNTSPIGIHDNFFDLGGHSLLAAQMIDQIEKVFQKKLPLDFLWFHGGTIASIASALRDQYQFGANPELVLIKEGSRQPLFALHIKGGHLLDYYVLARHLDPDQTVYGLQARGVFGNETPDCSIKEIAANCIKSMRQIQPQGPYLITGYSSGGVIAYEMAQQLNQCGESVATLMLLDTYCPWIFQYHRWRNALKRLIRGRTHRFRNLIYATVLTTFKLDSLLKISDVYKAHKYAHMAYQPRKSMQAIDFFIAEESTKHRAHKLLGWSRWVKGPIKIYRFPASHSDLVRLPAAENVAKTMQACINQALSD
jgi:amino acid adenylation domain-containing protein